MTIADYRMATAAQFVGRELGASDWVVVDQDRIDQFAACTGDRQWIHVDVDRATRESPFGGPIAHGYLTLSLVAAMVMELGVVPPDAATGLNYGLDKVRFIAPVKAGARVRTRATLTSAEPHRAGECCSSCSARWRSRARQSPPWSPKCCACCWANPTRGHDSLAPATADQCALAGALPVSGKCVEEEHRWQLKLMRQGHWLIISASRQPSIRSRPILWSEYAGRTFWTRRARCSAEWSVIPPWRRGSISRFSANSHAS